MMQAVHPDLILLDYFMPEMNGLAVIERLKADAATRRIPVVALTSGTAGDASRLSRAGSVGFIFKPFEPTEFLRLIADNGKIKSLKEWPNALPVALRTARAGVRCAARIAREAYWNISSL